MKMRKLRASLTPRALWRKARALTFHQIAIGVIVLNALITAASLTTLAVTGEELGAFEYAELACLLFFVVELGTRLQKYDWNLVKFLKDGWNLADTILVVVSLLPALPVNMQILRMLRLARVAHLARHLSVLRIARLAHLTRHLSGLRLPAWVAARR